MSDPRRVVDWGKANLRITPAPEQPPRETTGSVVIERRQATAYFDDLGRPAKPHAATWAKVWTPDGRSKMVKLT